MKTAEVFSDEIDLKLQALLATEPAPIPSVDSNPVARLQEACKRSRRAAEVLGAWQAGGMTWEECLLRMIEVLADEVLPF